MPANSMPANLVFFAAGSGITPFLQLLGTVVMPSYEPLQVFADYYPSTPEELALSAGQFVVVFEHYFDGWAFGENLNTNMHGVFPLSIVCPKAGLYYSLTLINCVERVEDIVGSELLDAAMLTYPSLLTVNHVVSKGSYSPISGNLFNEVLDQKLIERLVSPIPVSEGEERLFAVDQSFQQMS